MNRNQYRNRIELKGAENIFRSVKMIVHWHKSAKPVQYLKISFSLSMKKKYLSFSFECMNTVDAIAIAIAIVIAMANIKGQFDL